MKVKQVIPQFTIPKLPPKVFRLMRSALSSVNRDNHPNIQIADMASSFLSRVMDFYDFDVNDLFEDISVEEQDLLLGIYSLFCQRTQAEHWVCPRSSVGLNNSTFTIEPFGLSPNIHWEVVYLVRKTGEVLFGTPYDIEEYIGEKIFFNK